MNYDEAIKELKNILEIMEYDEEENNYSIIIKEFEEKYLCLIYSNEEKTFYIDLWNNYQDFSYGRFTISIEQAKQYLKEIETAKKEHAELSAIKQVVENWDEGEYYTDSIRSMKKIEDIIKGETK